MGTVEIREKEIAMKDGWSVGKEAKLRSKKLQGREAGISRSSKAVDR